MEMQQQYTYNERTYVNRKSSTASIILYIVLSFILSLFYFILVVVGLSLGVGTLVIWLGLPVLLFTFSAIWGIAAIERSIVSGLLGVEIPAPRPALEPQRSWWKRSASNLRDPLTWKSLLYILVKFPLSTFTFSVAVSFVATSIALILAPVGYLIATYVLMANGIHLAPDQYVFIGIGDGFNTLFNVAVTGTFDPIMFFKSFFWTPVGIAFWFLTSYILRGMGWLSAEFARVMLSPIADSINGDARDVKYTYEHCPE